MLAIHARKLPLRRHGPVGMLSRRTVLSFAQSES